MEEPPPPERVVAARSNTCRDSARDGIRVDAKRKHRRILKGTSGRGSVGTCAFFIQSSHSHSPLTVPNFTQIQGVASGLEYMHNKGVVHGDLKGVCVRTPQFPICTLTHLALR